MHCVAYQPAYCASKYAVEGYSEVLRKDMAPWGVTVHIIEPGIFKQTALYNTWEAGYRENWEQAPEDVRRAYGDKYLERGNLNISYYCMFSNCMVGSGWLVNSLTADVNSNFRNTRSYKIVIHVEQGQLTST